MQTIDKNAIATLTKDAIGSLGNQKVLAALIIRALNKLICGPVIDFGIVDFLALVAPDLVGADLVEHVGRAVPAEGLTDVFASTFGAYCNRAIGTLYNNRIDILFLLVVVIEIAALLLIVVILL